MKNLIALSTFFFLSVYSMAQSFERTYQDQPMVFGNVVAPIGNGETLVGTQAGQFLGWGNFKTQLHKLDNSGNIIWTSSVEIGEVFGDLKYIHDIKVLNDSTYYVTVGYNGCDYGGWNKLMKVGKDGTPVWDVIEVGYSNGYLGMTLIDSSKIFVATRNDVFLIDEEGTMLWSESSPLSANDVIAISDTSVLILGDDGYGLINVTLDPPIIEILNPVGDYSTGAKLNSGEILLLNDTKMLKLNADLELIDSFDFAFEHQFKNMDTDGEQLFLFGKNENDSTIVQIFNADLAILETHMIAGEHLIPRDIKVDNENLVMTAVHQDGFLNPFSPYFYKTGSGPFEIRNSSLWVRSFPIDNFIPSTRPDIGIVNIEANSVELVDSFNCSFSSYAGNYLLDDVRITIKNFGSIPVSDCSINGLFERCQFICPSWRSIFEKQISLNLSPGEEVEIQLGNYELNSMKYEPGNVFEVCFWTSNPDGKSDDVFSNNRFCTSFDYTTDVSEITFQKEIHVFPNPANDLLSLDFPKEIIGEELQIKIFNTQGQLLQQHISKNKKAEQLNIQNLTEGIYFLQIQNQKGNTFTNKFVKAK